MQNTFSEDINTRLKDYSSNLDKIKDVLLNVNPVTQERITVLKLKPWWNDKFDQFQQYLDTKFPGTHVVSFPSEDASSTVLKLDTFMFPDQNTVLTVMQRSACHDNCIALHYHDKSHRIFTGYALSGDGLWRHHSWIMTQKNCIVETTEDRLMYIGYDATNENKETIDMIDSMNNEF